jgi:hypothetical protein
VAAPENPVVVDDVADEVVDTEVERAELLDTPEVDDLDVPEQAQDADPDAPPAAAEDAPPAAAEDAPPAAAEDAPPAARGKGRIVVGAVVALAVAAGAVWAAGSLGTSETGLATSVTDPAVVITALQEGGISCGSTVVSGEVATCSATVAVRIFDSPDDANAWIAQLLKDPMTSSAFGWVQHGNAVVSAPLNAAPDVAAALGPEATVY